jgi:hypothetical protein
MEEKINKAIEYLEENGDAYGLIDIAIYALLFANAWTGVNIATVMLDVYFWLILIIGILKFLVYGTFVVFFAIVKNKEQKKEELIKEIMNSSKPSSMASYFKGGVFTTIIVMCIIVGGIKLYCVKLAVCLLVLSYTNGFLAYFVYRTKKYIYWYYAITSGANRNKRSKREFKDAYDALLLEYDGSKEWKKCMKKLTSYYYKEAF